jgi:hypothetical protein
MYIMYPIKKSRALLYFCFRKINHLVQYHLHSSSDVREVMSRTMLTYFCLRVRERLISWTGGGMGQQHSQPHHHPQATF